MGASKGRRNVQAGEAVAGLELAAGFLCVLGNRAGRNNLGVDEGVLHRMPAAAGRVLVGALGGDLGRVDHARVIADAARFRPEDLLEVGADDAGGARVEKRAAQGIPRRGNSGHRQKGGAEQESGEEGTGNHQVVNSARTLGEGNWRSNKKFGLASSRGRPAT